MRVAVVVFFVLLIAAVTLAQPAKSSAPACARACPQNYDPVCGRAKNGKKERLLTFGNACVLGNYNCDHANDPFEKKSDGECDGKVSVRLQ